MDASSSQGPFMLAALIFVLLNSILSTPEAEQKGQALKDKSNNTQVVLKAVNQGSDVEGIILEN